MLNLKLVNMIFLDFFFIIDFNNKLYCLLEHINFSYLASAGFVSAANAIAPTAITIAKISFFIF